MGKFKETKTAKLIRGLIQKDFGRKGAASEFASKDVWKKVEESGSRLWLDTGDIEEATNLWCEEFSGLTTNNTLLNKEVQKGIYDELIARTAEDVRAEVPEKDLIIEIAFVLNAYHALKLVRTFGCAVSVELHTDLAHDVERTYTYAHRYWRICPKHFVIKVPLTPEGHIATRRLSAEGVPVNFTLGFGARQNYLATALGRPGFVNVFLGRLNSYVLDNGLGDGKFVGEKATLASQKGVAELRQTLKVGTMQIAASMRSGEQVATLAGVDVLTMPVKVAREFEESDGELDTVSAEAERAFEIDLALGVEERTSGLATLWEIPDSFKEAVKALVGHGGKDLTSRSLQAFFIERGFPDLFPQWSEEDIATVQQDGKIPKLEHWTERLATGEVGLDALINLSGLYAFVADQKAMDERIRGMIS